MSETTALKIWAYARSSSSKPSVIIRQMEGLLAEAEQMNWNVVGTSQDMSTGRTLDRMGLHEMARAVRQGTANAVLVEDVDTLGRDRFITLRILEFLQDHDAVLICTQTDVRYELYIKGLSQMLHQRAARKGLCLPWREVAANA